MWDRKIVITGLGVIALAAIAMWFGARAERQDALGITVCAQRYRVAASLADTIRIDGQIPLERTKGELNPLTCGALRASYPDEVVPGH